MSALEAVQASRKLAALREKLRTVKHLSQATRSAEVLYKEAAKDTLGDLIEVDGPNGTGVRFEMEDGVEYAAIACQASTPKLWDVENLVPWLKENGYWDKVKTTVLDPDKLASEISVGNIPASETEKFQIDGKTPAAYVKFVNPKPDSK